MVREERGQFVQDRVVKGKALPSVQGVLALKDERKESEGRVWRS